VSRPRPADARLGDTTSSDTIAARPRREQVIADGDISLHSKHCGVRDQVAETFVPPKIVAMTQPLTHKPYRHHSLLTLIQVKQCYWNILVARNGAQLAALSPAMLRRRSSKISCLELSLRSGNPMNRQAKPA
jgi:hypothetical protein